MHAISSLVLDLRLLILWPSGMEARTAQKGLLATTDFVSNLVSSIHGRTYRTCFKDLIYYAALKKHHALQIIWLWLPSGPGLLIELTVGLVESVDLHVLIYTAIWS